MAITEKPITEKHRTERHCIERHRIGRLGTRLAGVTATVAFVALVAVSGEAAPPGVGIGPQKREPAQRGEREPERATGQAGSGRAVGLEPALEFSRSWFALTRGERRDYAMKLADRLGQGTLRTDESPFVRAMWRSLAANERIRLRRMNGDRRASRLTILIQRYAGHIQLVGQIPGDLDRIAAAGKIGDRERAAILAIDDDRLRVKAFLRLREDLLLRDMLAEGRIDRPTLERVSALPAGRERSRALAAMRARVVGAVNLHLFHVFLTAEERQSLKRAPRLHKELQRLETRYGVRFLRITPSADPRDVSRCLRLTRAEERALASAPDSVAREALVQKVYLRQRNKLIDQLSTRSDRAAARFLLRRILAADDARTFYRRATRSRSRT